MDASSICETHTWLRDMQDKENKGKPAQKHVVTTFSVGHSGLGIDFPNSAIGLSGAVRIVLDAGINAQATVARISRSAWRIRSHNLMSSGGLLQGS